MKTINASPTKKIKSASKPKQAKQPKHKDPAFYERLEASQEKAGVQWERLAEVIGLYSQSGMTRKRVEKTSPSVYEVEQWAKVLNVNPAWLAWKMGPQEAAGSEIWEIATHTSALSFDQRADLLRQLRTKTFGRQSPVESGVEPLRRADLELYQRSLLRTVAKLDARSPEYDALHDLLHWLARQYAPRKSVGSQGSASASGETAAINVNVGEGTEASRDKFS